MQMRLVTDVIAFQSECLDLFNQDRIAQGSACKSAVVRGCKLNGISICWPSPSAVSMSADGGPDPGLLGNSVLDDATPYRAVLDARKIRSAASVEMC